MLAAIGTFLGLNIVNAIRAFVAAVALTSSSLLVGYVKGRVDGAAIATANAAWLAEDLKGKDGANADAASEANRAIILQTETIEAFNDALEAELLAPAHSDSQPCIDNGWVQDVGKLR